MTSMPSSRPNRALRALARIAAPLLCAWLPLAGCQPIDRGGDLNRRLELALSARQRAAPVEIRGECYSACALKLASGKGVCVSPNAVVGVHEVRNIGSRSYADGMRDDFATGFFAALLPKCVEDLFRSRHAFDSGAITALSGRDILAACPQLVRCPG